MNKDNEPKNHLKHEEIIIFLIGELGAYKGILVSVVLGSYFCLYDTVGFEHVSLVADYEIPLVIVITQYIIYELSSKLSLLTCEFKEEKKHKQNRIYRFMQEVFRLTATYARDSERISSPLFVCISVVNSTCIEILGRLYKLSGNFRQGM